MLCLDTDALIHLWRSQRKPEHPIRRTLAQYPDEILSICIATVGEFLEGACHVSKERYRQSLAFLDKFDIRQLDMETASIYARIVSELRREKRLSGVSKADMWIASSALQHNGKLVTRNERHFKDVPGLTLLSF